MSLPLTPLSRWLPGTNQNSVPANDNSLRVEIALTDGIADDVTAQPGSPSDGDWYIIPSGATGAQWGAFAEDSIAIFYGGTWNEFVPAQGNKVSVDGVLSIFTGSGGWEPMTVPAAATWGAIVGTLSDQTDLQAALNAKAANRDAVSALTTSGSVAVNAGLGDYFTLELDGDVSGFTFSGLPGSGHGCTLAIKITQDSTPRTVGWPSSFRWAGGSAPAVSTGSGAVDLLIITTFDNGTTWQADLAKGYA